MRNSHQTTEVLALLNPTKENQTPPKYPFHSPSNLQPQLAATATDTPGGRHNDALAVELKLRQACQSCKFLLGSCVLMCPTPRQAPLKQSHLQMVDGFGLTSCVDPSFSTGLAGHRLGASSDPSELRKLCSPRPHTMIRCATAA